MQTLPILTQCIIALTVVLYTLETINAAPFDVKVNDNKIIKKIIGQQHIHHNEHISARQAESDDSDEDSEEDDGEDDAEQAQQNLIEQQNQQDLEESQERSDEEDGEDDGGDDARHRRRRRDIVDEPAQVESTTIAPEIEINKEDGVQEGQDTTNSETLAAQSSLNRTSVLILIRDALKKVTTVLPTEQVASNALQYFQLFEHFIQQTIEQVIGDDDDDEEESSTTIANEINEETPNEIPQENTEKVENTEKIENTDKIANTEKIENTEKTENTEKIEDTEDKNTLKSDAKETTTASENVKDDKVDSMAAIAVETVKEDNKQNAAIAA